MSAEPLSDVIRRQSRTHVRQGPPDHQVGNGREPFSAGRKSPPLQLHQVPLSAIPMFFCNRMKRTSSLQWAEVVHQGPSELLILRQAPRLRRSGPPSDAATDERT